MMKDSLGPTPDRPNKWFLAAVMTRRHLGKGGTRIGRRRVGEVYAGVFGNSKLFPPLFEDRREGGWERPDVEWPGDDTDAPLMNMDPMVRGGVFGTWSSTSAPRPIPAGSGERHATFRSGETAMRGGQDCGCTREEAAPCAGGAASWRNHSGVWLVDGLWKRYEKIMQEQLC